MKTKGLGYDPKTLAADIGVIDEHADAAMRAADAIDPKTHEVSKEIAKAAEAELGDRPSIFANLVSFGLAGNSYTAQRLSAVERIRKDKKKAYDAAVDHALQLDELKNALDAIVGRSAWPVELALAPDRGEVGARLKAQRDNALKEIDAVRRMLAGAKGSAGEVQFPIERLDRVEAALKRDVEILDDVTKSPRGSEVLADAVTTLAKTDPHEVVGPKIYQKGSFEPSKYLLEDEAAHLARTDTKPTAVPLALATRPADSGALFLLDIPTKRRDVEAAVHLPPGFDPTEKIDRPVVIVVGGRKHDTDRWLDKGGLAKNLDVAGTSAKPAPITVVVRDIPFVGLDDLLAEDVPSFVREHFGGNTKKVGVVAIGDKAIDVAEAAAKVASKLASVSIHAGVDGGEDFAGLTRHLERKGPMPSAGRAGRVDLDGLSKTKVYVSGSANEGTKLLALSQRLKAGGVSHDAAIFEGGDGAWADRSLDWLNFHGASSASVKRKTTLDDVSGKLEKEGASSRQNFEKAFAAAKARVRAKIDDTIEALDAASRQIEGAKLPAPLKSALTADVRAKRAPHETRRSQLESLPSLDDPRRAVEALLGLEDRLKGAGPVPVGPVVDGWAKLPAADQKRWTTLVGDDTAAATAFAAILVAKPKWLVDTEPKRNSRFIDQLESRIERGFLDRADLGEFLADAVKAGDPWLDAFETKRRGPEAWDGKKFVSTTYIEEHEPDGTPKVPFVPPSMQKQSADEGSFFIRAIRSKAIGKDMRAGVYLPPGYDPASDERYPVLMLLPGKGGKIETWLEQGDLKEHLDAEMSGSKQKMIVIVPDGNDSYYVNQSKKKKGLVDSKVAEGDFGDMVMNDVLPFATRNLNGDANRLSILGLSRGGYGALALSLLHPGTFKSVSVHGAVIPGAMKDKKGDDFDRARTTASVPSDWRTNPSDLVQEQGWEGKPPGILVSVGAADQHVLTNAIDFSSTLGEVGVDHHLHVLEATGDDLPEHNWTVFGPTIREAVGFHQSAHRRGAKPKVPKGFKQATDFDAAIEAVEERKKAAEEERKKSSPFRSKWPWED